jgi:hypothetical protein
MEFATGTRPWHEKWHRVLLGLATIHQSYSGELGFQSTVAWTEAISSFLGSAHHLHEWITLDKSTPASARSDAQSYMQSDTHLKIAEGFSNTDKHHTRKHGWQTQISSLRCTSTGNQARVMWKDVATGDTGEIDVLDLAEGCVATWRSFFAVHGLPVDD